MKESHKFGIVGHVILFFTVAFLWFLSTHPFPKEDPLAGTTQYNGTIANISYESTVSTSGAFLTGTSSTTNTHTTIELTDGTVFRLDDTVSGLQKGKCYTFWVRWDHLKKYEGC